MGTERHWHWAAAVVVGGAAVSCGERVADLVAPAFHAVAPSASANAAAAAPRFEYDENEAAASRDPFHPMLAVAVDPPIQPDPGVAAVQEALDSLKLGGTILDAGAARAMLTDASGFGWIVRVGDRVGRPERIDGAPVYWRIDRIRAGEVVLRLGNDTRYAATRTRTVTLGGATPRPGISL